LTIGCDPLGSTRGESRKFFHSEIKNDAEIVRAIGRSRNNSSPGLY